MRCDLCVLGCRIAPGRTGACGVRWNREGVLHTVAHRGQIASHIDPIEKKPLYHFLPGTTAYSIGTLGCSFRCLHCQNHEISQRPRSDRGPGGSDLHHRAPGSAGAASLREVAASVVRAAARAFCSSIAYTYSEPTVFFELALETARLASSRGLANAFVTNGSFSAAALGEIAPWLDAANVDLKGFDERTHRRVTGAPLAPILDRIAQVHARGIWLEVTTLVIPGVNDSPEELRDMARFLRGLSADVPWHVTRFFPTYRMLDRPATPEATLRRARAIGFEEGLHHVYVGNVRARGEDTRCPGCGAILVRRRGMRVLGCSIRTCACPSCGATIPGVWGSRRRPLR